MPKPSHAGKLEQNVLLCNEINVTLSSISHEVLNKAKTVQDKQNAVLGPKQEQRSQADEQINESNARGMFVDFCHPLSRSYVAAK